MIIDTVMKCCERVGVPQVCSSFCMPSKSLSKQPDSHDCKLWMEKIGKCRRSIEVGNLLESCCLKHKVAYGCSGMCKGSCEDRPWTLFTNNSPCDIHVINVQNCCNNNPL